MEFLDVQLNRHLDSLEADKCIQTEDSIEHTIEDFIEFASAEAYLDYNNRRQSIDGTLMIFEMYAREDAQVNAFIDETIDIELLYHESQDAIAATKGYERAQKMDLKAYLAWMVE